MTGRLIVALSLASAASGAVVVDRIAVIVGNRAIKTSDLERDLRVSQLLNNEPARSDVETRRKVAERLIDQELVRQEMLSGGGGYRPPGEKDVDALVEQLRRDRFGGSEERMSEALARYGLTTDQLRRQLLWQLTVLRFIDQRFRPAVLVTDQDVSGYYKLHRAAFEKAYPQAHGLEALQPKIREILTGERVNELFEEWLKQKHATTRIEYRDPALERGANK